MANLSSASSSKPKFPAILTWQDPIKSGTVFGQLLAVLLVLRYGNLFRISLRLVYWTVGTIGAVEFVTRKFQGSHKGLFSSYKPSRFIGVSQTSLEVHSRRLAQCFADSFADAKQIIDGEDLGLSLFVFIASFIGYILTGFLSISALLLMTLILAFSAPPVYLQFQTQIDELLASVQKELGDKYEQVHKKASDAAGPHIAKAKAHINSLAGNLGVNLNRGGFPSTPADKKVAPVAKPDDIPGPAANPAEPVVKSPKLSKNAADSSSKAPSVAEVLANADSVPTLVGNVSLDSTDASKFTKPVSAGGVPVVDETATDSELFSDLKDSIKSDKESLLN